MELVGIDRYKVMCTEIEGSNSKLLSSLMILLLLKIFYGNRVKLVSVGVCLCTGDSVPLPWGQQWKVLTQRTVAKVNMAEWKKCMHTTSKHRRGQTCVIKCLVVLTQALHNVLMQNILLLNNKLYWQRLQESLTW